MKLMRHNINAVLKKFAFWKHKINAVLQKDTLRVHKINADWGSSRILREWTSLTRGGEPYFFNDRWERGGAT